MHDVFYLKYSINNQQWRGGNAATPNKILAQIPIRTLRAR